MDELYGASEGTRTLDLRFTKPMLYQLSYAGFLDWISETFDNNQRRDGVSSFALSQIAREQTRAIPLIVCCACYLWKSKLPANHGCHVK